MTAPWLYGDETRLVQGRPDLHPHLPVGDLAILDVSPGLQNLEPAEAFFIDCRLGDSVLYGSFDAGVGGSDQLNHLVGVFTHGNVSGNASGIVDFVPPVFPNHIQGLDPWLFRQKSLVTSWS